MSSTEGGPDSAALAFAEQETKFAEAAAAAAAAPSADDRPLTGAKQPAALDAAGSQASSGVEGEEGTRGPPSKLPPGDEGRAAADVAAMAHAANDAVVAGAEGGPVASVEGEGRFMTALG